MPLKFTQKLNLMLWKNCRIIKNNKFQLAMSLLLPIILGFIGVGFRLSIDVRTIGVFYYSRIDLPKSFDRLVNLIEERRQKIKEKVPDFTHSVFAPKLVVGICSYDLNHEKNLYQVIENKLLDNKVELIYFNNCERMKEEMARQHYLFALFFQEGKHPLDLKYTMYVSAEFRDFDHGLISETWILASNMDFKRNNFERSMAGTEGGRGAVREGVAYLQNMIAIAHIEEMRGNTEDTVVKLKRHPHMAFKSDPLLVDYTVAIVSIVLSGYLFPSVFIVTMVVNEKETGVRNYLSSRGLHVPIQQLAWCIVLWCITAFSSLITTILFKISWNNGSAILTTTSGYYLLMLLLGYCWANASFCIMISAVTSSKHKAIPFLTLCWLLSFIVYLHSRFNNPFAEDYGFAMILMHNALTANILHYSLLVENFESGMSIPDLFNMKWKDMAFITLILSGILFFFLGWGLDRFKPGLYGQKFDFPGVFRKKVKMFGQRWFFKHIPNSDRKISSLALSQSSSGKFNKMSNSTEPSVDVINLTKTFGRNQVFHNFYLSMFLGEILVCLGPNGCGKTVLSLMLGGLMNFDAGVIQINDTSVRKSRNSAMDDVGIAIGPQLMIPDLSFMEQLIFYSRVKGIMAHHSWNHSQSLVAGMDLDKYFGVSTRNLPFMVKRQLAVICAFAGNTNFIILDSVEGVFEGTLGRDMCSFVAKHRIHKTIFITTSSTTIAAVLSHRIIYIHEGNIVCNASVDFLKDAFGREIILSCLKTKYFKEKEFSELVTSSIPEARLDSNDIAPDLSYIIPGKAIEKLPDLLDKIEENRKALGVDHFYIRQPNLEDICRGISEKRLSLRSSKYDSQNRTLQIDAFPDEGRSSVIEYKKKQDMLSVLTEIKPVTGIRLFQQRFKALLWKQYISHSINKLTLTFYFLIPTILILYGAILAHIYGDYLDLKPRTLNITKYPKSVSIVTSTKNLDRIGNDIVNYYTAAILNLKSENKVIDLMQDSLIDYANENQMAGTEIRYIVSGMKVTNKEVVASFNCIKPHADVTALAQVHTAFLRSVLVDHVPEIAVTLAPMKPESVSYKRDFNVMRFLSFCLALGLWFVFGLSSTGISFERNSFNYDQHSWALKGSSFWIGYVVIIITKYIIVICIILLTMLITEYRLLLSVRMVFIIILISFLGAFYFKFVKVIFFVIFYEIEKKYIITIFLTIVSIIVYNFVEVTYLEMIEPNMFLVFLPLNIIARLFFFAFFADAAHHLCGVESIYQVSVYAENCKAYPNCCNLKEPWELFWFDMGLLLIIVSVAAIMAVILAHLYRTTELYTCKKIPLTKPKSKRHSIIAEEPMFSPKPHLMRTTLLTFNPRTDTLDTLPVFLDNVGKSTGKTDLVSNVSFIIRRGDSFTLLGPHGPEKQMLLRLISGNIRQSYGRIFCYGQTVIPKFGKSLKVTFGFALPNLGRVHFFEVGQYMEIYALMVGIPKSHVRPLCKKLAEYMNIMSDYYKIIAVVSTSTRRRMTFVMAFIGNPQIVVMDISLIEIDFSGKDLMLALFRWYLGNGGTIILSVPYVSDGVLFGTRLAVMVNGHIQAIGSIGTLTERLAHGYQVVTKVTPKALQGGRIRFDVKKERENAILKYCNFIESTFENAAFKVRYAEYIYYFIPFESTSYAQLFQTLEEQSSNLNIKEYYITQDTLEFVIADIMEKNTIKRTSLKA